MKLLLSISIAILCTTAFSEDTKVVGEPWPRHTIDSSSRGADGVRLLDVNGDGQRDIATGWEEGGIVRVYLHPGAAKVREAWPSVTVGEVKSPEDAVFADVDGDGAVDVISSCEGKTRSVFVHWAPKEKARYLDSSAWKTEVIPACRGKTAWMYALPMQVDGQHGVDLILGSKGGGAGVFWLEAPANARDLASWKLHRIVDAGWIMSLRSIDLDADGDRDVLVTDRKGRARGTYWLEHPAAGAERSRWPRHAIDRGDREVMFLDVAKNDSGYLVAVPVKSREVQFWSGSPKGWAFRSTTLSEELIGRAKGVALGDIDGDRALDIVFSCEGATGNSGIVWWTIGKPAVLHDISGPKGTKYDRLELVDLDGDGDLDVMTCEEREGLGVFWHENPASSRTTTD